MTEFLFEHHGWKVCRWTSSMLSANIYLVAPMNGDDALLIDAGGKVREIIRHLKGENLRLKFIVLTHKHLDHSVFARRMRRLTGARIVAGKADLFRPKPFQAGGKALDEGDKLDVGHLEAEIIQTPGHTPGGISIKMPGAVFTGDTLFAGGIGRTDLKGGSMERIMSSIGKLMNLPDDTVVYPGHGPPSTVGREKAANPFITGKW